MGRAPCCDKNNVKRGPWSPEEDAKLKEFIEKNGTGGNWIALPQKAGLKRCGKSCRLRWLNYLRPNIKHGEFSDMEDRIICSLYANIGSRWSIIAAQLPGRTDNDIKNYWNTKLKKKLIGMYQTNQRKLLPFSSSLPPPPPPPPPPPQPPQPPQQVQNLSNLSQLLRDCNLIPSHQTKSLTSHETISISPNLFYNNNNNNNNINIFPLLPSNNDNSYFQIQEGLINPSQYYPLKENMIMFGSNEASCSSSDGSCSQISYGKDQIIKQENINSLQGFISNNCYDQEQQRFILDNYGSNNGNASGNLEDLQLLLQCDDHLEDVKQLISYSNNNNSFYINDDENKTHDEKTMYFY